MNDALTSVINNIYQNHKFVDPTEKEELPSLTALNLLSSSFSSILPSEIIIELP